MTGTPTIACIGECMVEFRQTGEGVFAAGFGGDTLNTAVYLSRLGRTVDYVSALGDDAWSEKMLAAWRDEGVGTERVLRVPGGSPGLYVIEVDDKGERRFSYWRDLAPARRLFELPESDELREALLRYDWLYVSGISLSLYGDEGRRRLFETLDAAKARGARIVFDTNFRPRGWPDRDVARASFLRAFEAADLLFASTEDLHLLFGEGGLRAFDAAGAAERVLKHEDLSVLVTTSEGTVRVDGEPASRVVDTTAAGDSFAAAYLSARIGGASPPECASAGHGLAARVVQYPGALIPKDAMAP